MPIFSLFSLHSTISIDFIDPHFSKVGHLDAFEWSSSHCLSHEYLWGTEAGGTQCLLLLLLLFLQTIVFSVHFKALSLRWPSLACLEQPASCRKTQLCCKRWRQGSIGGISLSQPDNSWRCGLLPIDTQLRGLLPGSVLKPPAAFYPLEPPQILHPASFQQLITAQSFLE